MSDAGEIPARSGPGGSELIDYSLKETNRRLILERRKVQLLSNKNPYSSANKETIDFNISPGAGDEWLDGRSSFITANVYVSGKDASNNPATGALYIPNGLASCFNQVQVISASGQQLVNILDYSTIQQMFTEYTTCPTWKQGIGQMYGTGSDELKQWQPARYITSTTGAFNKAYNSPAFGGAGGNPATYNPFVTNIPATGLSYTGTEAIGADVCIQQPAGEALNLQHDLSTNGVGVNLAFRIDLAWIFGCPTLIPSQFFPLTLRLTLEDPQKCLSYAGVPLMENANNPAGPYSTAPGNANCLPGIYPAPAALVPSTLDITWSQVRFMASVCKVSPALKQKVDAEMASNQFSLTVTNYYAALNTINASQLSASLNTTFSAHDCQAFWVSLIPQTQERNVLYDYAWRYPLYNVQNTQLQLNGRYWPPQPNATVSDHFHDTLASFNTSAENVSFSPISLYRYAAKSFVSGTLLDRDANSSLTGVNSVASPVWTWTVNFNPTATVPLLNVHTCIAYTQVLRVAKEGQIQIFQ